MTRFNKLYFIVLCMSITESISLAYSSYNHSLNPHAMFAQEKNAELYWKALILAANNKKEEARQLVAAIKAGTALSIEEQEVAKL